jgi:hypothetical protein
MTITSKYKPNGYLRYDISVSFIFWRIFKSWPNKELNFDIYSNIGNPHMGNTQYGNGHVTIFSD